MIGVDAGGLLTVGAVLNMISLIWAVGCYRRRANGYWPGYLALIGGAVMLWGFSSGTGRGIAIGGLELLGILAFLIALGLAGYTFVRQCSVLPK